MLLLTGGVACLSLFLPLLAWIFLPVQFLNTHVHEFFHALATALTGGAVGHIEVFGHGGGVTQISGGSVLLAGSAGYLGAALLGSWVVYLSGSDKGARSACAILGAVLVASLILWVRGDGVGVVAGIAWVVLLLVAAFNSRGPGLHFLGQLVGMLLCLYSAQSLLTLLGISASTSLHSDARVLEAATGVPALFWAGAWFAFGLAAMGAALKGAWRQEAKGV